MLKTLTANQNPPNFNELKHLKWQTTTAGRAYNKDTIVVYWYGVTAIFSVVTILEFLDTLKKIYIHIAISLCNAIFDIMRKNCHKKEQTFLDFHTTINIIRLENDSAVYFYMNENLVRW